jgi:hypothetical protein
MRDVTCEVYESGVSIDDARYTIPEGTTNAYIDTDIGDTGI